MKEPGNEIEFKHTLTFKQNGTHAYFFVGKLEVCLKQVLEKM